MILTTSEAAAELGCSENAVHILVHRGRLKPIVPGASSLRFHLLDVADTQVKRRTKAERDWLDTLSREFLDTPAAK